MNAQQIVDQFVAKGYTPMQVANAVIRKEAHVARHGNAVEKGTWAKAVRLAKALENKAYAEQDFPGQIPCNKDCMGAHEKECVCPCGGANHGVHATKLGAA